METHKPKRELIQVVKGLTIILLFMFFTDCSVKKEGDKNSNDIKIFKSKDKLSSYLSIESYEYESPGERIPVFHHVNNIILDREMLYIRTINVLDGEFKVKALFPGKLTNEVTVNLTKGDSIVVKFYLKDDPTPLHTPEYVPQKKKN
tara:strand:- start:286 stop:726 length:441 start_codon:yes stop_codon:yes gene_type:complete